MIVEHLHERYGLPDDGPLTDFLSRRGGRLWLDDRIRPVRRWPRATGHPLEVSYCPLVARQIDRLHGLGGRCARRNSATRAKFIYAYATKANFAEEVVRTAIAAGAHYETSSAFDAADRPPALALRRLCPRGRLYTLLQRLEGAGLHRTRSWLCAPMAAIPSCPSWTTWPS